MDDINWNASATVHARDDAGSDMYFDFRTEKHGTLAEMVAYVMALPHEQSARLVIDIASGGTVNMAQIVAMAQRSDYPGHA
ncbi:MAG: hypothetical protein R3E02_05675 [Blastomonas sp.]